jgi:hypothetical protein
MRLRWLGCISGVLGGVVVVACSVGQGDGYVRSTELYVPGCWKGSFNLQPDFFAANPFDDTLTIRVQRGERDILVSDGFTILVYDVARVRAERMDTELKLGLPVGVSPLGFPLPSTPHAPDATLSLYLNNSCRAQNAQLFAVNGWVQFTKLFSGDPNEDNSDDRITFGRFHAKVADPRTAKAGQAADGSPSFEYPDAGTSDIDGEFNFVFHRGTPAQPFP